MINIIQSENISWLIINAKWDSKITSRFNKIAYIACKDKIPFLYKNMYSLYLDHILIGN